MKSSSRHAQPRWICRECGGDQLWINMRVYANAPIYEVLSCGDDESHPELHTASYLDLTSADQEWCSYGCDGCGTEEIDLRDLVTLGTV